MSGKNIKINRKKGNGDPSAEEPKKKELTLEEEKSDQDIEPEPEEQPGPEPTPEEKIAELTDRLQRLAAEFENYKKKNAHEFERGHMGGSAYVLEKLLPVLDSFDMAHSQNADQSGEGIIEGLGKIRKQLLESMLGMGLKIISPKKGDELDPNLHEVLMVQPSEDQPEDTIFATLQRGYSYKDRLLRAAKVQVAKAP